MKIITDEILDVKTHEEVVELAKKYDRVTKLRFNCAFCGRVYIGTIRYTIGKKELCCKQCNIDNSKLERYGSRTYNNPEKAKETNIQKIGVSTYFKLDSIKEHNRIAAKDPERRAKISASLRAHDWTGIQERKEKTIKERYGSWEEFQKIRLAHFEQTCIEKYGVRNVGALNAEKEYSSLQKYFYEGRFFDSSYELKYFIWLRDHNVEFEYHNKKYFRYKRSDGSTHRYYPDFYVNGQFIEIKGEFWWNDEENCLIDRNGNLDYDKTNCMKEHNVLVKTKKDLVKEFEYVDETYGKDFVKQFRYTKEKKSTV